MYNDQFDQKTVNLYICQIDENINIFVDLTEKILKLYDY